MIELKYSRRAIADYMCIIVVQWVISDILNGIICVHNTHNQYVCSI